MILAKLCDSMFKYSTLVSLWCYDGTNTLTQQLPAPTQVQLELISTVGFVQQGCKTFIIDTLDLHMICFLWAFFRQSAFPDSENKSELVRPHWFQEST